jgi:hypothetical protein
MPLEDTRLKVYIAGPMRNHDDNNFPAFYEAEDFLEKKEIYTVVNPARMDDELYADKNSIDYKEAMRRDLLEIFECDSLYMLRGWAKSEGALVEHALAIYLNLFIMYQ